MPAGLGPSTPGYGPLVHTSPEVLRQYALLADGERGALIGPHGDVAWMCAPRWDSDAVFSELIGGGGAYLVQPATSHYVWGGYYEEGTLIWRSRWVTTDGIIECREALSMPGDPHTAVLLRRVTAVDGPARLRVVLDPRADFGRSSLRRLHRDGATWTGRAGPLHIRWSGAQQAREGEGGLELDLQLPAGGEHDLVLELSEQALPAEPFAAGPAWEATEHTWARSVPELGSVLARRDARHSYAVLRGMTSSTGGMVASATTSLPERAKAGRNYDYRYVWIRDQCYAGQAVAAAGAYPLLDDLVGFVSERVLADGPQLRPAYRIDGGIVPGERSLPGLAGYPGGSDKIGNWVGEKFQLDAFGEVLLLLAAAARHDRLDVEHWRAVETCVAAIEQRRGDADQGIWEVRDDRWAHSRLICAAGLRAIAHWAAAPQATRWTALADSLVADAAGDCLHPSGRWQRTPTDPKVDAALLLPAIRGALPASDPRSLATLDAVRTELIEDGYVYRFRHDQRPLYEAEGAFLLCGFFAALATHQQGDEVEAHRLFERNRAACGPAALFSEEYDVVQRQLRGNLPQAFVHALLLESAVQLTR